MLFLNSEQKLASWSYKLLWQKLYIKIEQPKFVNLKLNTDTGVDFFLTLKMIWNSRSHIDSKNLK